MINLYHHYSDTVYLYHNYVIIIITRIITNTIYVFHYRTWSKGSRSPTKQTPPTSPRGHTISYNQRPSSTVLKDDIEQSTFQRSYSTSAAYSPRKSPELLAQDDRSMQNLAETFRFQVKHNCRKVSVKYLEWKVNDKKTLPESLQEGLVIGSSP